MIIHQPFYLEDHPKVLAAKSQLAVTRVCWSSKDNAMSQVLEDWFPLKMAYFQGRTVNLGRLTNTTIQVSPSVRFHLYPLILLVMCAHSYSYDPDYMIQIILISPSPGVLYTPPPLHTFFVMYEHRGGHRRFEKVNLHIACEKYEAHGGTVFPHGLHTLTQ